MAFKFTEEQLNTLDKSFIVNLFLQLQDQNDKLSGEIQELNKKMEVLIEQITLANKNRFGRSSEKMTDTSQICFMEVDGTIVFFNEAEAVSDLDAEEPDTLENKPARTAKVVGKKDADIKDLPVNIINHYLTDEELVAEFGENGWKQLPDAISKRYRFIPAKVEIDEHHVGVYASKTDDRIIKADHPKALLHGSLVSPTIAAAIMNGKYVNAVPLYRLEQEFSRYGLTITRQNMANWMIRLGESYLAVLYDYLHQKLYNYHVIQADETPVLVNRDGRSAGSKSYMWVYRSGHLYTDKQIVLYDYHKTRNSSHPREFLRDYSGICVTDGYQVYHTIEKEREDLQIAGCWVHARRKFDEALTVIPKAHQNKSNAFLVIKQIQAIYREEGKLNKLSSEERLMQRQLVIKPLVDALFAYLKKMEPTVPASGQLRKAYTYILNQSMSCLLIGTHSETRIAVLRKNSNTALSLRCSRYSLKLVTPFTSVRHASRKASISQSARNSIGFSISANGSTPSTGFSFIIFCFRIQVKNADRLRLSLFTVDAMFPAPRKPVA